MDASVGKLPEPIGLDSVAKLLDSHIEAILMAGGNLHAFFISTANDLVGIGDGHGHRLLDDQILPRIDAVKSDRGMLAALGGDGDQLDLRMLFEHLMVVGVALGLRKIPAASFLQHDVELRVINIAQRNQIEIVIRNSFHMVDRNTAAPDNGTFHFAISCLCPNQTHLPSYSTSMLSRASTAFMAFFVSKMAWACFCTKS